jgi:predicted kinase
MSKYDPLWQYIQKNNQENIVLSFDDIRNILGFKIDHSFLNYKKELKDFGYQVTKISLKEKKINFIKNI